MELKTILLNARLELERRFRALKADVCIPGKVYTGLNADRRRFLSWRFVRSYENTKQSCKPLCAKAQNTTSSLNSVQAKRFSFAIVLEHVMVFATKKPNLKPSLLYKSGHTDQLWWERLCELAMKWRTAKDGSVEWHSVWSAT